jgi:type I restriction enzyme S subunit
MTTKTVKGKAGKKQGQKTGQGKALPEGWRWVKLGDVCDTTSGGTPSRGNSSFYGGSIPWVKSGELNNANITSTEESITQDAVKNSSAKVFKAGTLLIAMYGATVGKLGILDIDAATNQAVCAVFPSEVVERDYLFFYLLAERSELLKLSFGGAQPNISQTVIRALGVLLPPISEQKRIVGILRDRLAAVEQARQATQAQLEAAQALPAAYLRQIFNSPEAQTWEKKLLGKILKRRNEVIHPRDNPSGPATFVGLEHIQSEIGARLGSIDVEMSELTGRKPRFHKGDIVYGYLRPYLNKVWIAEFDGLCSVDQYIYTTKSKNISTDFVAWFMRSPVYMERAPVDFTPGQLPRIRADEVASTEINIPDIEIQKKTVLRIDESMSETLKIQKSLQDQLETINALPAALLRQAFNGEL